MPVRLIRFQSAGLLLLLIFLLLSVSPGCSGGSPLVTPTDEPEISSASETESSGHTVPWSIWDISLNESGEFDIVPLRSAQYTCNVNMYLQPPFGTTSNIDVDIINDIALMTTGRITITVGLTHPFPANPEFSGFDVLGVFMHNGSETANHDSKVRYARPGTDAVLLNADGYTRWMNRIEFTAPGLGGYTEGALGNKGILWTATINPYKYFCDTLSVNETIPDHYSSLASVNLRGLFQAGSTNTRTYSLKFPMVGGYPNVRFQYAVVASWCESVPKPPNNIPGDFPDEANIEEPFFISLDTEGSTAYWNSSTDNGGTLILNLEIFDHGARDDPNSIESQIDQIIVESPDGFIPVSGNTITFLPADWTASAGSSLISQVITLDCGTVDPQGSEPSDNTILVAVRSLTGNWNTDIGTPFPTGRLYSYQSFEIALVGWTPSAPGNVPNFQASDGDGSLNNHEVELTWDEVSNADSYQIQRRDYDLDDESWSWTLIHTAPAGSTSWIDTNARYSGPESPIDYRIRGSNAYGYSPQWSTDTGYSKLREVGIAFYCAADNTSGLNAVVPWTRALADFNDNNSFWNDYGFDFIMENGSGFYWMTTAAYRNLNGSEPPLMHAAYGQIQHPDCINVYYVASYLGNTSAAFSWALCPGSLHNTLNTFIVMTQDARTGCPGSQELNIVLAHENGHSLARFWDMYELDLNGNGILDDGTDCSINTWCNGLPPYLPSQIPVMYCDENAAYPEEPDAWSKTPKNLMWYSFCGSPVSEYDITTGQYVYVSEWIRSHEGGYPVP